MEVPGHLPLGQALSDRRGRFTPPAAAPALPRFAGAFFRQNPAMPNPIPAERHAAARALFESVPNITFPDIARQVGAPVKDVRAWREADTAAGQPWRAAHQWDDSILSPEARELAKRFREAGAADLGPNAEANRTEAEREAVAVAAFSGAVNTQVREELLKRHREEWVGPRALAYQAMKTGKGGNVAAGFEMAKLAKISAETLTLVQAGERKAYGIEGKDGGDGAPIVVVERAAPAAPPAPSPAEEALAPAKALIKRGPAEFNDVEDF